jgi:hypothetical protein
MTFVRRRRRRRARSRCIETAASVLLASGPESETVVPLTNVPDKLSRDFQITKNTFSSQITQFFCKSAEFELKFS